MVSARFASSSKKNLWHIIGWEVMILTWKWNLCSFLNFLRFLWLSLESWHHLPPYQKLIPPESLTRDTTLSPLLSPLFKVLPSLLVHIFLHLWHGRCHKSTSKVKGVKLRIIYFSQDWPTPGLIQFSEYDWPHSRPGRLYHKGWLK